jgi:hypothetical protein
MNAQHLSIDELADAAEGLLDPANPDGSTHVTVVTGCAGGAPSTGPSAVLSR